MKSNTWTIIKKEFARFFGDRQLIFTTVILPGLLIYIMYSLMGSSMASMMNDGADEMVTVRVENRPESVSPLLDSLVGTVIIEQPFLQADIDALQNKDRNEILVRFPADFDQQLVTYSPAEGLPAPNIEIYYNSTNNASSRVYSTLEGSLVAFENAMSNRFDINRCDSEEQVFNQASEDQMFGDILSKLLPMLIIMMLFSGVMAFAPSSIAGEKERGTIATLLVTPLRRNQLAIGKVVSLSCIAMLSGISSFLGIILSLPKMMQAEADLELSGIYTTSDYMVLLLIIFSTVLIMSTAVSILSALAKDVKNAGTLITPLMLVMVLCGLLPMFQGETEVSTAVFLIPFYNSIELMTEVFAHNMQWTNVVITIGANLLYTALGIWGLTKMFNNEKVMFSR